MTPYLTISNKQTFLKYRVHLINIGSDSYAVFITAHSIPHNLPQLMYDYLHRMYFVIHEEIYDIDYVPPNDIYTIIRDSTLMSFYNSPFIYLFIY
ncbi:MAG: hypothetical protein HeimC3_46660 [Candidatus Heimdallarchaeota archaeon LC_3]|nr:MAG: hypothetical protein HeimC3_46660 [Candidatus Heimdallarchaeota archaeon LC_3]